MTTGHERTARAAGHSGAWSGMSVDEVLELVKEVSRRFVEPRFQALGEDQIEAKSPGDYVTVADREAEAELTRRLRASNPGAVVVGEEGSFADPQQLHSIGRAQHCFVIDPLDGTNNFVRGSQDFAVMVAELRGPETVASWIWQPRYGRAYVAQRRGGVYCNGQRIRPAPIHEPPLGASSYRPWRGFDAGGALAPVIASTYSAGIDYPHVVTGVTDFVVYRFPKPWDHLPGQLMLRELGGEVIHLDGRPYRPGAARGAVVSCRDLAAARRIAALWPSIR